MNYLKLTTLALLAMSSFSMAVVVYSNPNTYKEDKPTIIWQENNMFRNFLFLALLCGTCLTSSLNAPLDEGLIEEEGGVPREWYRNAEGDEEKFVDQEPLDLSDKAKVSETLKLFNVANCGIKNGPRDHSFIVGGVKARPHSWPWAIGLIRFGSFICGGSILSGRYILTAAHCVSRNRFTQPASSFQVLVGAHNLGSSGQLFNVDRVIAHEGYDENFMQNDIALLRLRNPINFNQFGTRARPVCLPSMAMDARNYVGSMSTVVGWGTTREGGSISQTLRQVMIPIISNQQCSRNYNPAYIRPGQICAAYSNGGKDSCQGDSGGSLMVPENGKYYQLGVVSWGSGCARPNAPGVYTRVTKQLSWIARNAK